MARYPLPDTYMTPAELAKRMGLGLTQVKNILHQDHKRDLEGIPKVLPFAFCLKNEGKGTWQYRIHRKQFETWDSADFVDTKRLAFDVADAVIERLRKQTAIITPLKEADAYDIAEYICKNRTAPVS